MPTIIANAGGKPVTLPLNPAALLPPGGKVIYASIEPEDAIVLLGGGPLVARMGLIVEVIGSDKVNGDEGVCPVLYAAATDLAVVEEDLAAVQDLAFAALPKSWRFHETATIAAVDAEAGVDLIPDELASGVKLEGFALQVNGATAWSGDFTKLVIEDTSGLAVAEVAKAALVGNAVVPLHDANVTVKAGFVLGCGMGKGLRLRADDAVVAGSNLRLTFWGANFIVL